MRSVNKSWLSNTTTNKRRWVQVKPKTNFTLLLVYTLIPCRSLQYQPWYLVYTRYSLLISRSVLIKTAVNTLFSYSQSNKCTYIHIKKVAGCWFRKSSHRSDPLCGLSSPCPCLDLFWHHSPINAMGYACKCTFKFHTVTGISLTFF